LASLADRSDHVALRKSRVGASATHSRAAFGIVSLVTLTWCLSLSQNLCCAYNDNIRSCDKRRAVP
jgi:hypothetical protein